MLGSPKHKWYYLTRPLSWIKHPIKPNLWRYYGRGDDIIVLFTGDIETSIHKHPLVIGALTLGQGQFQVALLVELR